MCTFLLLFLLSQPFLSTCLYRKGIMVHRYRMNLWLFAGAFICCTASLYPSTCLAMGLLEDQLDMEEPEDAPQPEPTLPTQLVQQGSQPLAHAESSQLQHTLTLQNGVPIPPDGQIVTLGGALQPIKEFHM